VVAAAGHTDSTTYGAHRRCFFHLRWWPLPKIHTAPPGGPSSGCQITLVVHGFDGLCSGLVWIWRKDEQQNGSRLILLSGEWWHSLDKNAQQIYPHTGEDGSNPAPTLDGEIATQIRLDSPLVLSWTSARFFWVRDWVTGEWRGEVTAVSYAFHVSLQWWWDEMVHSFSTGLFHLESCRMFACGSSLPLVWFSDKHHRKWDKLIPSQLIQLVRVGRPVRHIKMQSSWELIISRDS
jgi:hypothetical protein